MSIIELSFNFVQDGERSRTMNKLDFLTKKYTKQNAPMLQSGDTVRVHERIKEGGKERTQIFEGLLIAKKHGTKTPSSTFTVRKIAVHGIGVEKIFPLHSPNIQKVEVLKHDKVRRAKLYYLRDIVGKKKKRKAAKILGMTYEEPGEAPKDGEDEQTGEGSKIDEKTKSQNDQVPMTNDQTNPDDQNSKNDEKINEREAKEEKEESQEKKE